MAGELSTAGVTIGYAVELTAGTRPTTGYTILEDITGTPDFNPTPATLDVTPLSEPRYVRKIPGLQDVGDASAFPANLTNVFMEKWATLVEEFKAAQPTGLSVWFEINIPDLDDAFYFTGEPRPLGLSALAVNSPLQIDAYIVPNVILGFVPKAP